LSRLWAGVLLCGCAHRVALPVAEGPPPSARSASVHASASCAVGADRVEVTRWREAVEARHRARVGGAGLEAIDAAHLRCRTVLVDGEPAIVGANRPAVVTLQRGELELQVEVRWTTRDHLRCVEARWLGRSRWRVVPQEPHAAATDGLTEAVEAALDEALDTASLEREARQPCPAPL